VRLLDKPVDQVVIEARIVIRNESFARELGAKFGISGKNNNVYFNNYGRQQRHDAELLTIPQPIANRRGAPLCIRTVLPDAHRGLNVNLPSTLAGAVRWRSSILNAAILLDIELSALQTEGRGEVISNPRIVPATRRKQ
jgi:type IV pilus assembly protein PilQ